MLELNVLLGDHQDAGGLVCLLSCDRRKLMGYANIIRAILVVLLRSLFLGLFVVRLRYDSRELRTLEKWWLEILKDNFLV